MRAPRLSVVMPTRNQAPFIRSAVASVLAQAGSLPEGSLELVIADGASDDGTPSILAELAAVHPGVVHWVSEPDRGPADAVNKAVARARGDIIGWLNSDDLYAPGAAARALQTFAARPELVMVYGEGEHVDVDGAPLGRYPTRAPDTPLAAWADGCPICQPTAFFRREAFDALGGLDISLRTAFDYDFWLRLFKAYPGRVGFVPQVQALSRLHAAGITLRMREQVAMEGMQVVARHIGPAPPHWLVTHVAEALSACPFDAEPAAVQQHLLALADRAAPWLGPGGASELKRQMQSSAAWQLVRPNVAAGVYADGWAPPDLELRLRQPETAPEQVGTIRLHGRHAWPRPGRLRLRLTAWHDGRALTARSAWWRRRFVLDIPVTVRRPGAQLVFHVRASDSFVPANVVPGSRDTRALAFIAEAVELLPAT